MTALPVIAIVPTHIPSEELLRVSDRYVAAVVAAGGAPLMLPLTHDIRVYETLLPLVDGFLLTGGHDINPERYGESATSDKLSELTPEREEVECLILSYAYQFDIPLLGICRGMQMINVFFGGTLHLDLADQFSGKNANQAETPNHWQKGDYDKPTHFVNIVRASKLGSILKAERLATNSIHHQGVRDLAPLLDATAYGPDGLVEAVEVRDRSFIMGVQWHPEFFADEKQMGCLFSSLVREAEHTRETGDSSPRAGRPKPPSHLRIEKDGDGLWPDIRFADCI